VHCQRRRRLMPNNKLTAVEAEAKAIDAYVASLNTTLTVIEVDVWDPKTESPKILKYPDGIEVTVVDTPPDEVVRWIDNFFDSVWNVQSDSLVCEDNPDGEGWIFGPSFEIGEHDGKEKNTRSTLP